MMKLISIYLHVPLLFILQISSVFANEVKDTWYFYKVSKQTVSGEIKFYREWLIKDYANTKIELTDNKLIVDKACRYEYKKSTTTPISYWGSTDSVNLYKKLF